MVLYDTSRDFPLSEYGIEIPILGSNSRRTVEALLSQEEFRARRSEWLIERSMSEISRERISRVHDSQYVSRLFGSESDVEGEMVKTYELIDGNGSYNRYNPEAARHPLSDLFRRACRNAQGTVEGAHIALETGFCFYLGGGMHHAHFDHGSGFCPVNDIVIAARDLRYEGNAETVWVIDVDAHKGDGTAALTVDDPSIVTLSEHMAKGWPLDRPDVDVPSDIDIPIEEGNERNYLLNLRLGLERLKGYPKANFAIVLAGADPYERDELASARLLKLSLQEILQRDLLIESFLRTEGIPALFIMAGNYGPHSWEVYTEFLRHRLIRSFLLPEQVG